MPTDIDVALERILARLDEVEAAVLADRETSAAADRRSDRGSTRSVGVADEDRETSALGDELSSQGRARLSEAIIAAGKPDDVAHIRVIQREAGALDLIVEAKQEKVNVEVRGKLSELFSITGTLQGASIRLFGILVLVGAAIGSVILKYATGL